MSFRKEAGEGAKKFSLCAWPVCILQILVVVHHHIFSQREISLLYLLQRDTRWGMEKYCEKIKLRRAKEREALSIFFFSLYVVCLSSNLNFVQCLN